MKAGYNQAASPAVAVPMNLAACYAAWLKARRGKRPSANQLAFEVRWLDRLVELKTALRAGRWQPSRTVSFIVSHPKTREIHAPDFADRVVHHLLVERLEKLYEPVFIQANYANRSGKGSHAAVDRLQQFMRSRNGQGWYLQLDIHNYFKSINRLVLYRMLCRRLQQCERRAMLPGAHALALRSLCHKLLANKVTERVRDPVAAAQVVAHCRSKLRVWAARHVRQTPQGTCLLTHSDGHPSARKVDVALAHLQAMLGSYWGHFAHAQSVRLHHALFEQFTWLKTLFVLHPDRQLSLRWVLQGVSFSGQAAALQAEWPQAQCLIQKGNRWLLLSQPGQEFNTQASHRLIAGLRRQGIAFVCANQTGWLRATAHADAQCRRGSARMQWLRRWRSRRVTQHHPIESLGY